MAQLNLNLCSPEEYMNYSRNWMSAVSQILDNRKSIKNFFMKLEQAKLRTGPKNLCRSEKTISEFKLLPFLKTSQR